MEKEGLFVGVDLNDLANMVEPSKLEEVKIKQEEHKNPEDKSSLINDNTLVDESEFTKGPEEVIDDPLKKELQGLREEVNKDKVNNITPKSEVAPSSPFNLLAQALHEEGVLAGIPEEKFKEIKTVAELNEVIKEQIKSNEYSDLNPTQKKYLEALRSGLPQEFVQESVNRELIYSSLTDDVIKEDADLRKQLLINDFTAKGYSQTKAEEMVKRSVDLGKDIEDALDAKENLKRFETERLEEAKNKAVADKLAVIEKQKKDLEDLKSKVLTTEEFIKGHKTVATERQATFETMTKIVGYDNGRPLNALMKAQQEDPQRINIAINYLFYKTNGFQDLSAFGRTEKTNALKELENKLNSGSHLDGGSSFQSSNQKGLVEALKNQDPFKYL